MLYTYVYVMYVTKSHTLAFTTFIGSWGRLFENRTTQIITDLRQYLHTFI